MKFKRTTMIKGKDLKDTGIKFYKVLREDMKHHNMQYKEGENVDVLPFNPSGYCESGGLYFTEVSNICEFIGYGNHIREVTFSNDEDIYIDDGKFKAHTITLGPAMMLSDVETWKILVSNDTDNCINHINCAVKLAIKKGYLDVVKYLKSQYEYIRVIDNYHLYLASENGHLEVIQYLIENGVNVHADDDFALRLATNNGHFNIVKYLVENGADIHAENDYSLKSATKHSYLDIVEYLSK